MQAKEAFFRNEAEKPSEIKVRNHARRALMPPLIARVARRARKRNRVAHVGKAGDISERALEAEPEPRMRHGAVAAQIAIPAIVLLVDAALRHARVQDVEALFALAAADDFADARR